MRLGDGFADTTGARFAAFCTLERLRFIHSDYTLDSSKDDTFPFRPAR
jgi:hypothetical protein